MAGPADQTTVGGAAHRAARLLVRLRWWVIAFWAVATLASLTVLPSFSGGGGDSGLKGILSADTPAVRTEKRSVEHFGFPLIARTVVVQRDPDGLSPYAQARTVVRAVAVNEGKAGDVRPLLGALPVTNAAGIFPGSREKNTAALTYLLFGPDATLGARTRAAHRYARQFLGARDAVVGVTGSAPARAEQGDIISAALPRVEIATLLAVMVIVGVSFRSLVAPLVTVATAGVAYVATLRLSGALTQLFDLPSPDELEPVVVALLLGAVTDYVVFFCSAVRGERGRHRDARAAATRAIARSGPIVAVAGLAVAFGTAALLAAESPFFRALGPALAFTVVVGLVVAVTLVPALVAVLGDVLLWPSSLPGPDGLPPPSQRRRRRWSQWRRRRRWRWPHSPLRAIAHSRRVAAAVLALCVVGLLLAAVPLLKLQLGVSFVSALPAEQPVRTAARSAQDAFADGILSPTVVLLEGKDVGSRQHALSVLGDRLSRQPGVAGVLGPGSQPLAADLGILVTGDRNAARYLVVLDSDPLSADAVGTLDRLRDRLPALLAHSRLEGVRAGLGGDTATASFLVHQTEGDLRRIALVATVVNFLMLLVFLRSLVASTVLLLTSLLSLAATLGLTTAVFEGLDPGQGLTFYVPFAAAVLLLAFGSDYNIFTVGHVWEAARDLPLRRAISSALPMAVLAVTVAGGALAASFGLLGLVPLLPFRQLAFAVGVGIVIDVLVVRALVVPALLSLLRGVAAWPSRRLRQTLTRPDAPG